MSDRTRMNLVSIVILIVLGLQLLAATLGLSRWGWPFTDYPMYAVPRHEGDRITAHHFVYAIARDGREIELTSANIGLNVWLFRKWAEHLVAEKKASIEKSLSTAPAKIQEGESLKTWVKSTKLYQAMSTNYDDAAPYRSALFVQQAEQKLGIDIVQIRIEDLSYVVTRDGMKPAPRASILVDVDTD